MLFNLINLFMKKNKIKNIELYIFLCASKKLPHLPPPLNEPKAYKGLWDG